MKTSKIFSLILVLSLMFSLAIFSAPAAYADCDGGDDCTCCGCGGKGTCGDAKLESSNCAEALLRGSVCSGPVRITKQPTDEVNLGGCGDDRISTCFIIKGDNIARVEWYCRIGATGEPMLVEEAVWNYGLGASGYDTTVLYIDRGSSWHNINGWQWAAIVYGCEGDCKITRWASTLAADCVTAPPCYTPPVCAPAPCTPVAPPCTAPATACAPAWGCGYGFTEIESVTTSYSETASIEHSYGIRYW